jgi:hypothetical protein
MDPRTFNSLMPKYNEEWAAKILKMKRNYKNGVDLTDDKKIVEIKFTKNFNKKNHYSWKVIDYQMNYPEKENKKGFWGLGFYELNTPVSKMSSPKGLENFVNSRELVIVNWDWMNQFKPFLTKGKTELSEWELILRYPKFNKLPEIGEVIDVEGGKIFFSKDIDLKYFENIFKNSSTYYSEECPF